MKRLWGSTLLLALVVQVSHGRPQSAWQVRHSNQVAQPYVVHSDEFEHFPRFPLPVAGNNRRQDSWQPVPRPSSQNVSPVPKPSGWGAPPPRPGAPFPAAQRVPYPIPPAAQPPHLPPPHSPPPPVVRVRPGEQVAIVLNEDHGQKDVVELENLLSILKKVPVSAEGAHHLYVAPPHYTAPQGYTRFNATYLDNEDEIHRNPPPVYVAPVHYRAPDGYHRLPLPTRWVQFESQQGPAINQGSVFIATTAAPIPVNPDFEQTVGAQVQENLNLEPEQELKVEEPVTLPTEPSTTTTTTTESPSTTARLVLAADRPSFLAATRRPVQRPLSLSRVTAAPAAVPTTPSVEYSTSTAPKWPQFQQAKRPVGANRLNVPETPASSDWTDSTKETIKGDQLAYGQKLKSKDRNQLSSTIPLASDKPVEVGGGKGAVVSFAAEYDEPVLETGEAFQLSESQNSVNRPPKIPNVSLLKPTATEAPKIETTPEVTSTPSTTTTTTKTTTTTTTTETTTPEDDEDVTATTFNGGRFTQFATTPTSRPQGPSRGDQRFQLGVKVTSTSAPEVNTNPSVRPSLSFTRPGSPARYSPYEIVRQMQKQDESEVVVPSSTAAPSTAAPQRFQPRPILSGVQFTESNEFRKPAWGTEEDLGKIHEGFSPVVPEYGVKQGTKSVPLIRPGSANIRRPTFPKLNQPLRIRPQRPPVVVDQELEEESDFVPIETFDNEPLEEVGEQSEDYVDDFHHEEEREEIPFEEEIDGSNVEDSDLAASDDAPQDNIEVSQEDDLQFQPDQFDETQENTDNDQETEGDTAPQEEQNEQDSIPQEEQNEEVNVAEPGNLAGEEESEAVQEEETANFSNTPTDAATAAPVPESSVITAPPAASEPERQEPLEEEKKKEEKPLGKLKEDKKSADKFRKDKTSGKVLGVSTATEVSLMYEICFKGKCVKVHE